MQLVSGLEKVGNTQKPPTCCLVGREEAHIVPTSSLLPGLPLAKPNQTDRESEFVF